MNVKKAAEKWFVRFFVFTAVILAAVILQGCASTPDNYNTSYLQLIHHFGKFGLKISEIQPINHMAVSAESAFAFKIGPRQIGVYKYNPKLKKHRQRLEYVDKNGIFYVVGYKFKAIRNGSYILTDYDKHPDGKVIEKAFRTFK